MQGLSALVIYAAKLERSVAFYRACGFPLAERKQPHHFACATGGVHISIHQATDDLGRQSGTAFGLTVNDLQHALDAVRATGAKVIEDARPRPWGVSAVVEDPDGRRVELVATQSELTGPVPR